MIDLASISQVASSLKVAGDITKAMVGLGMSEAFRDRAIQLQQAILDAQGSVLEANAAQTLLSDRIRDLEKEVADLKAWDSEKSRYELVDLYRGIFAFVLKEDIQTTEPPHALCAHCYNRGLKSYLQTNGVRDVHQHAWACKSCGFSANNQWHDMAALIAKSRDYQRARAPAQS